MIAARIADNSTPAIHGLNSRLRQHDEDALGIRRHRLAARMRGEVGDAEEAHRHRAEQAQHHPGHADAARLRDRLQVIGRHEARQDVRLPEIPEAPGQQRDDADEAERAALEGIELRRIDRADQRHALVEAAACR